MIQKSKFKMPLKTNKILLKIKLLKKRIKLYYIYHWKKAIIKCISI